MRSVALLMSLVGLLWAGGEKDGAADSKPVKLRLAENQPENNPVTVAMRKFADLVAEKSNGQVEVDVYASAQLGQETENIEQVVAGVLDMARVSSITLAEVVKEIRVFTLPYIFRNQDIKYKVLDGEIGRELLAEFPKYGLVSFGYLEAGARNFYTVNKPVLTLADLKGMKIRIQKAKVVIDMIRLLGGTPTPMNYGEVYSALQTGVIDGAENDFVSYYTSGHYEVAKHFTQDAHLSVPALIIFSKAVWDKLTNEQQQAVKQAAAEATTFERKAMNDKQLEFRKLVEEAGTVVHDIDTAPFQEAVLPLYQKYPEFSEIIERIRQVN